MRKKINSNKIGENVSELGENQDEILSLSFSFVFVLSLSIEDSQKTHNIHSTFNINDEKTFSVIFILPILVF